MDRRKMIIGSGVGVALVGSESLWWATRVPRTASVPWTTAPQSSGDVRLDVLRYAILAPNPHNRQPWLMRLVGSDIVDLFCDLSKRLPQTDPFDRQITIGFGAFLEVARIAAAERGIELTIESFPEGEPHPRLNGRPVARLRFANAASNIRDPLFRQIVYRRSTKEPYDVSRLVSDAAIEKFGEDGEATSNRKVISRLQKVILCALEIEAGVARTHMESVRLLRIGNDEIDANPDGIALTGPKIKMASVLGLVDRKALADPTSAASKAALDQLLSTYGSIPALFWVKTPGNSRTEQLEAGRRYVRANLQATALGLAMHPASQSLQEYPEMDVPFRRIHQLLGASGSERIQMMARVGYRPKVFASPRWPLEKRLIT